MNPLHPHRKSRSLPRSAARSPAPRALSVGALLLIPLLVFAGSDRLRDAIDFTSGVLSLVSLTAAVVWGLVATDRLFLHSRQRLLAQAVHRATAIASVGFLLLHGTVKVALDHVSLFGALMPFGLGVSGSAGLIGLGSLAGLLMIATAVTGALRSAFASPARIASRWRALHMLSYPAWCSALIHGLYAGREPKPWVVTLYALCLVAVAGAVALRAAPPPVKRKVAARILALLEPDRGTRRREEPPARDTVSVPLPGTNAPTPSADPVVGISAAYRALTPTASPHPTVPPPRAEPTGRWPAPSPPPPAESPYVAPQPTYDTAPQPVYDASYDAPLDPAYDPLPDPAYDSGPATEPLPRPFQAPSTGEPWNAATGGHP
ncbi:hypothetical protein ABZ921_30190 [Streptomyces atriruber]|uniref:Cytochrome b/b6 domain-containing protein n=1 Tax=Streptomyces atriruber TaxID=545121 RepID=A0ABV3BV73_9ACTN